MRKALFLILAIALSMGVMAQQKIQLRSVDKAECVKSDMTSLEARYQPTYCSAFRCHAAHRNHKLQ